MNNSKVVAISGVSGAGKTTIVKQLAKEFNCPYLLFDDHTDQNTYPEDMKRWLKNGTTLSDIKTPKFVSTLQALISIGHSRYIFIEEPFGKERDSMASLIDYVVLLDPPLEICLTRIIKRHIANPSSNSTSSISSYLEKYDDHLREIYISAANQVRLKANLRIQEVSSVQDIIHCITRWLKSNTN